jgi:hypothetical protein
VNRNRWIVGIAIFVILFVIGASLLLKEWKSTQPQINQRSPVLDVGYCSPDLIGPCVVSFSLNVEKKNMLVNILTPGPSFPEFYLKIKHSKGESTYNCLKITGFATSVYCIGDVMPIGEILQFMIISKAGDILLAEGEFAIIGLALATPEISGQQTASSTPNLFLETPTPIRATPSPSYPYLPYP